MKIRARIVPNERKYYGTEIQLKTEDGREATIVVWINGISDYVPSEREIDFRFDGRSYVRDGSEVFEYEICDDHYETQTAYDVCKKIVAALDNTEV